MAVPASPLLDTDRAGSRSTREAVLDAAERLFAERGFEATSLNDVGAAAGVSRGTPGYFFGSKAELYRAVLERCFAEVRAAVRAYLAGNPIGTLEALRLEQATSADGRSATVTVSAIWRPPVVSAFVPEGLRIDATAVSRTVFGG